MIDIRNVKIALRNNCYGSCGHFDCMTSYDWHKLTIDFQLLNTIIKEGQKMKYIYSVWKDLAQHC